MSEGLKIVLTAAATLIGGVILFIAGQMAEVLVITPLRKYKVRAQITIERVDFHSNKLTNYFADDPSESEAIIERELSNEVRTTATQLKSAYIAISFRPMLVKMKIIPSRTELDKTFGSLVLLSNNLPRVSRERGRTTEQSPINVNNEAIKQIKSVLGE